MYEVTEKNINDLCGRLKKFFYNKNQTGFIGWHNFDCGWKNIKPYAGRRLYICPKTVETDFMHDKYFIRVVLNEDDAFVIDVGDKIQFNGNKVIIQSKWKLLYDKSKYIYQVFQCQNMNRSKKNSIIHENKIRHEYYEEMLNDMFADDYKEDFALRNDFDNYHYEDDFAFASDY